MARSIYRSDDARAAIRRWCEERLTDGALETRQVETSLGSTFTATTGAGHDVVLLPGTNFATATWTPLIETLRSAGRVTAVDLPGQPGMSAGERPARDAYGPWLREVIAARELVRPVVVGHSLGGLVALLGASGSDAVGGLVLVDTAGLTRLRLVPGLVDGMRWLLRKDAPSSRALLAGMSGPGVAPPEHLVAWMTLVARHVRSSLAPRPLPAATLAEVRCPARVVTGQDDLFLSPRKVGLAAGAITGPTAATEVPRAGHLLPFERPDVVLTAVRDTIALARASSPDAGH